MNIGFVKNSNYINVLYSGNNKDTNNSNKIKKYNNISFKESFDKCINKNFYFNSLSYKPSINKQISFKGLNVENNNPYENADDENLKKMLPLVKARLNNDKVSKYLNKYNIILVDKILSDKELSNNEYLKEKVFSSIELIMNAKEAFVADKVIFNPMLNNNKNVMKNFVLFFSGGIYTKDSEKSKIALIEKVTSDKDLYTDENVINSLPKLVGYTSNNNQYELVNKILSDSRLYKNKSIIDNIEDIIFYSYEKERTESKTQMIDYILSDKKLSNNENINNNFDKIILNTTSDINLKSKKKIIKTILSNKELRNNEHFINNLAYFLAYTNQPQDVENNIKIGKALLLNKATSNNKNITDNFGGILKVANNNNFNAINEIILDLVAGKPKRTVNENLDLIKLAWNGNFKTAKSIILYRNLLTSALQKKDQLRASNGNITFESIETNFRCSKPDISNTIEMFGDKVIEAVFPHKLDGIEEFVQKCTHIKESISAEDYEKLLLKFNPENSLKYQKLEKEIKKLKTMYPSIKNSGDNIALKLLQNEINTKTKQSRELIKNQLDMSPQEKISKINVLSALAEDKDFSKFLDLVQNPTEENEKIWLNAINEKSYTFVDCEYDKNLSDRLNLTSNKYLPQILSADEYFKETYRDLLILIKNNPDKSFKDIFDSLPQNLKTKDMFANIGINYDKWCDFDKNSSKKVEIEIKSDEVKYNAISSLENEFNSDSFLSLPPEYTDGIYKKFKENNICLKNCKETIFDNDGFPKGTHNVNRLYINGAPIKFNDLKMVIDILKEEMNKDIWTKINPNQQIENNKSIVYTHIIKDRLTQIKEANNIKGDKIINLEIHKTDMNNINHSLFLGNHASCCTAVGSGCNQFSAPTYIKNKMVSAIEIFNGDNFVGNTMCYIAKVDDKPSLILDNIELKGEYQFNDKIRDAIFDYSKQLCADIGKPDLDIYAGPYLHKTNMEHLPKSLHNLQLIGSTGEDEIYLDFLYRDRKVSGDEIDKVELYKIR